MITPRPDLVAIRPAEHGGRGALDVLPPMMGLRHDFSACVNAHGPPPNVTRAIRTSPFDEYPDPSSRAARSAAASHWQRPVEEVAMGAGATELIHAVARAYLRPGDAAVVAQPGFGEYERAVAICGGRAHGVQLSMALGEIGDVDSLAREIVRARPRLAFVASPVSPTGETIPTAGLRLLADACGEASCLLILDQSYDAFLPEPLGVALPGHDAVLHIRSLTKELALAGARVGFAIAPAQVIEAVERVRVPWIASTFAQSAAVAAFAGDALMHVARTTHALRGEARRIAEHCEGLGLTTSPTRTHYMTIACGDGRRARLLLLDRYGILVRDCASFGFADRIRIAARLPAENDHLVSALSTLQTADGSHTMGRLHG